MPAKSHPKLLRFRDLTAYGVPLRRTMIYKLIEAGEFPAPIRCGLKACAFDSRLVDDWIAAKLQANVPAGPGTKIRKRADLEAA
ncbi:MAG TPA: AlpA family phage regulatory protein [Gammaproteobacteria bacterium]|nr:AlpA family phage regulatory protein [Gammaproteobacteria bacterium]